MGPKGRYVLRAGAVAVAALLAAMKSSIGNGIDQAEWVDIAAATWSAFTTYLGLGALLPQLEPNVGVKAQKNDVTVEVPVETEPTAAHQFSRSITGKKEQ